MKFGVYVLVGLVSELMSKLTFAIPSLGYQAALLHVVTSSSTSPPLGPTFPLQSSPLAESQLLHHAEEQARRDVELTNAKRAKLQLEESVREYQARYCTCMALNTRLNIRTYVYPVHILGYMLLLCSVIQFVSDLDYKRPLGMHSNCYRRPRLLLKYGGSLYWL